MTERGCRGRRPAPGGVRLAGLVAVLLVAHGGAASAQGCATTPVMARGEPARFEVIAKTQARANWRRKVRGLSGLGVRFADWQAAEEREERCIKSERTVYCIFTGTPCYR